MLCFPFRFKSPRALFILSIICLFLSFCRFFSYSFFLFFFILSFPFSFFSLFLSVERQLLITLCLRAVHYESIFTVQRKKNDCLCIIFGYTRNNSPNFDAVLQSVNDKQRNQTINQYNYVRLIVGHFAYFYGNEDVH